MRSVVPSFSLQAPLLALSLAGCAAPIAETAAAPRPATRLERTYTPPASVVSALPLDAIDPVVVRMPAAEETSIEAVARYIAARVPDRRRRIKALHDWVADRVAYAYDDLPGLPSRPHAEIPPMKLASPCDAVPGSCPPGAAWGEGETARVLAERAFVRRSAVCAGYAALLHELGKVTGDDIAYVTGTVASDFAKHAWNVAVTDRGYEPIDVTWDARSEGGRSGHPYSARWLFVSPSEFAHSHIADDPAWDLGASRYAFPVAPKQGDASAAARAIESMVRRW
jgi:hypothetical protein